MVGGTDSREIERSCQFLGVYFYINVNVLVESISVKFAIRVVK